MTLPRPGHFRATVKGTAEQALAACSAHDIHTAQLATSAPHRTWIYLDIPSQHLDKVYRWFNERTTFDVKEGFPPGTLLNFNPTPGKEPKE